MFEMAPMGPLVLQWMKGTDSLLALVARYTSAPACDVSGPWDQAEGRVLDFHFYTLRIFRVFLRCVEEENSMVPSLEEVEKGSFSLVQSLQGLNIRDS